MLFCFVILACSLSRLWRRTFLTVSPPPSARWRHVASRPLPSAQACPMRVKITKERTKETVSRSHSSSADAVKAGVGRNSVSSTSAPGFSSSALLSSSLSFRSRSSHSDASLCASSSAGARTRLPTSVVERKPSTVLLHLSSASMSRTFQRLFHLPVSFLTSAQRVLCLPLHSTHSLKRWSRVCVPLAHHQH